MVRAIKEPKIVPWGTEERVSFSVEDSVTWGGTGPGKGTGRMCLRQGITEAFTNDAGPVKCGFNGGRRRTQPEKLGEL